MLDFSTLKRNIKTIQRFACTVLIAHNRLSFPITFIYITLYLCVLQSGWICGPVGSGIDMETLRWSYISNVDGYLLRSVESPLAFSIAVYSNKNQK